MKRSMGAEHMVGSTEAPTEAICKLEKKIMADMPNGDKKTTHGSKGEKSSVWFTLF